MLALVQRPQWQKSKQPEWRKGLSSEFHWDQNTSPTPALGLKTRDWFSELPHFISIHSIKRGLRVTIKAIRNDQEWEHRNCQTEGDPHPCVSDNGQHPMLWRKVQETPRRCGITWPPTLHLILISSSQRLAWLCRGGVLHLFQGFFGINSANAGYSR